MTDPPLSKLSCRPLQKWTSKPLSPVLQAAEEMTSRSKLPCNTTEAPMKPAPSQSAPLQTCSGRVVKPPDRLNLQTNMCNFTRAVLVIVVRVTLGCSKPGPDGHHRHATPSCLHSRKRSCAVPALLPWYAWSLSAQVLVLDTLPHNSP